MVWGSIFRDNRTMFTVVLNTITANVYIRMVIELVVLPFMNGGEIAFFQHVNASVYYSCNPTYCSRCEHVTLVGKITVSFAHRAYVEYDWTLNLGSSATGNDHCPCWSVCPGTTGVEQHPTGQYSTHYDKRYEPALNVALTTMITEDDLTLRTYSVSCDRVPCINVHRVD